MRLGELYTMAKSLKKNEKIKWKDKILLSMEMKTEDVSDVPLEVLVLAVSACFDSHYYVPGLKVIAYGAGKMAHKYIPQMIDKVEFYEIWDAYSDKTDIYTIPITRPEINKRNLNTPIVIFIDDLIARYDVLSTYKDKGYNNIFYFRDYMEILEYSNVFENVKNCVADTAQSIIEEICNQYEMIENPYVPVLFSVLNKNLSDESIQIQNNNLDEKVLENHLLQMIEINHISQSKRDEIFKCFLNTEMNNKLKLVYNLEVLLRRLLEAGVKTLERPMRMVNDRPYDEFAVAAVIEVVLYYLFEDYNKALEIVQVFRVISENSISLVAAECYFLMKCGNYVKALETTRYVMEENPNDLLINETFYQVAKKCKENGIYVEEPIPEYDLSKRFCWSGLNFVWCGGFNQESSADFSPCFRPLQCAARPGGEFWSGDDWKEFRKSVTDGSFRYCQKNQCPNIVAGWLPKKSECKDEWLNKILDGDFSVIPPIEELHFSYDSHCNLKCPSCRTDFQTNTKEENKRLDEMYEKNLKPYMRRARHLTLSGCGEAIISPHSKKILKSFSKQQNPELAVELRTNVTAVNEKTWNALGDGKAVVRHITASIDASTKESFEKLRYPAKWEIVLENLKFIQMLRNRGEIDMFEFHVVVQKENIDQLCDITKMAIAFDADAVTFSRLINWRGMSREEYHEVNPFWSDHFLHGRLVQELENLEKLRKDIEDDKCDLTKGRKKIYINIHFSNDPNSSYDVIRTGKLKIR